MPTQTIQEHSLTEAVISFGRVLKDQGFAVSTPSVMDALAGISCVGVESIQDFKEVLRAFFMTRVEESAAFDRLFGEFWIDRFVNEEEAQEQMADDQPGQGDTGPHAGDEIILVEGAAQPSQEKDVWNAEQYVIYSPHEVLREQDFGALPKGNDERIERLIQEILSPLLRRLTVRRRRSPSGVHLDFRRLLRRNIRYGGEIWELPRLRPKVRIKKLVFLCDVSGSMNPYLPFMLRFIKGLQQLPIRVETFVFATRLHRITRLLKRLAFARAMQAVAAQALDWSGGTRIGSCLREFTRLRGGGMLGSSTVVLIFSDGWDRGDQKLLEQEMSRIRRRSYRVLWINPLMGGRGYEPTCKGMKTALPHIDFFLPGHNISSLERLAGTLKGILF